MQSGHATVKVGFRWFDNAPEFSFSFLFLVEMPPKKPTEKSGKDFSYKNALKMSGKNTKSKPNATAIQNSV